MPSVTFTLPAKHRLVSLAHRYPDHWHAHVAFVTGVTDDRGMSMAGEPGTADGPTIQEAIDAAVMDSWERLTKHNEGLAAQAAKFQEHLQGLGSDVVHLKVKKETDELLNLLGI